MPPLVITSIITKKIYGTRGDVTAPSDHPRPRRVLALEPEELAAKLLFLIRNRSNLDGRYHAGNLENELWHDVPGQPSYPRGRQTEISLAMAEALAWLEAQGLAVPDAGLNGSNGWRASVAAH